MKLKRLVVVGWLFGLILAPQASPILPLAIEQLAERAQLILLGRVNSKTCQRDAAGRIYTALDFQVAEAWKGALATNRFTVVHGGGLLGEERAVVSGQPEYQVGEECLLFLALNQRGEGVTIGTCQGKFVVWQDTATGQKLARNTFFGGPEPAPLGGRNFQASAQGRLTVSDLKQKVLAAQKQ
jgi:hypothetical protein